MNSSSRRGSVTRFLLAAMLAALAAVGGLALLMNIFERKQEAKVPFFKVVELTDDTTDPAVWGKNFPAPVRRLQAHRRRGPHPLRR